VAVVSPTPVIEVVSDVVCPWCFIGKRRLEKALALVAQKGAEVHWKAFELNPQAPKEGMDRQAYRARKFGSAAYAKELEARVIEAGAEEGIEFHFDRVERVPNTFDAHRLIWLAGREGSQDAIVENLFHAYFIDGQDVGNPGTLQKIASQSGLDSTRVDELFHTDLGQRQVHDEEREAHTRGVNGVPSFFLAGLPVMSGAQKPEILASAFGVALGQCSLDDGACA
jgi:predicted DsbA family dithiol-disulfide isomerase